MEIMLMILLFIILLVAILSLKTSLNNNIHHLRRELNLLQEELKKQKTIASLTSLSATPAAASPTSPPTVEVPISVTPTAPTIPATAPVTPVPIPNTESNVTHEENDEVLQQKQEIVHEWKRLKEVAEEEKRTQQKATVVTTSETTSLINPAATPADPPRKPGFFERNPDLEKFIGENLINKIGIAILVLGIGFFVKYAIDQNWIGEIGRVGIGILCGIILIVFAHRMRNQYKAFSSVLVGGGLAVFYFTISLAYHQFHLFNQIPAFIIMVIITAFAVILSLLYNRQELAIIALIGGFCTPFLASNGSGNYISLFTYLLILNIGLLLIAYQKNWRVLNVLAFSFTVLLTAIWMAIDSGTYATATIKTNHYFNSFLFITAFYLLFFGINIANNIKEKKKFIAADFGILLINTALYFTAGIYLLGEMQANNYDGLFCVAIGVFNLTASYFLFRKQKVDTNILYLLIGITLTFISLSAPVQLHGNHITLFWATECVLLYWLYQRSSITIIRWSSLLVWACMIISLLIDWGKIYSNTQEMPAIVVNKAFITGIVAAISSYLLFVLRRKEINSTKHKLYPAASVFRATGIFILFFSGVLEINHQFQYYYPNTGVSLLYILTYTFSFALIFIWLNQKLETLTIKWAIAVSVLSVSCLLYLISIPDNFSIQHLLLKQPKYVMHFTIHWISAILVALLFIRLVKLLRSRVVNASEKKLLTWVLSSWAVVFLSVEINHVVNQLFYKTNSEWTNLNNLYIRTGLPILWGLCSLGLMWMGMQFKFRPLRIAALSLFTITLFKLFFLDIREIPAGGKIAAFCCLGILLLVVSFMYQRLKRILSNDEEKMDS